MMATRPLILAIALGAGPLSAGGDLDTGQRLAVQCIACHGAAGIAPNPTFPHLTGQNATYLAIQLQDFRSGERFHPVMSPIAEVLSDQDIDDLSVYFESVPLMQAGAVPVPSRPEEEE